MPNIRTFNNSSITRRVDKLTGEILEEIESTYQGREFIKNRKAKVHFIMFIEENYNELCKLVTGKAHQAFGLLCRRIQNYPSNSVDLSQSCRAYLQKNLEIKSKTNVSKILRELKDKDLLRAIPEEPGTWMINPNFAWKGSVAEYEDYLDYWDSLEKGNRNPDPESEDSE